MYVCMYVCMYVYLKYVNDLTPYQISHSYLQKYISYYYKNLKIKM